MRAQADKSADAVMDKAAQQAAASGVTVLQAFEAKLEVEEGALREKAKQKAAERAAARSAARPPTALRDLPDASPQSAAYPRRTT